MNDKEIKLENYRNANKSIIKGQIVFAGSSLMEMFPIAQLLKEHHDNTIIYNRGIGGFVSSELLDAIDICVLDLEPSKVFINIGTNDLSDASKPISQIMDTYDQIISAIEEKLPDIKIYLMAYYPVNYEAATEDMKKCLKIRTNEKIALANEKVRSLALKHHQRYIDINDNLKDGQGRLKAEYTIEGMHINPSGYRAIYGAIMKYVKGAW